MNEETERVTRAIAQAPESAGVEKSRRKRRETRTFDLPTSDEELQRLYIILTCFAEMDRTEATRVLEYVSGRVASDMLKDRRDNDNGSGD